MRVLSGLLTVLVSVGAALPLAAAPGFEPPAKGRLKVAFVMTRGAEMIDFAGPWEVFQDVHIYDRGTSMDDIMPFELFTVGESKAPIRASGGMTIVPDYAYADAPQADIVVVGAQKGGPGTTEYLKKMHAKKVAIMSVCTGASLLADAGLLDGKEMTTHHKFFDAFRENYPKVKLVPSRRYVQADPRTFTAAGLSSGIDLALHLVALYFGDTIAEQTATFMEYESTGWRTPARTAVGAAAK